jgi:hypothetical protein
MAAFGALVGLSAAAEDKGTVVELDGVSSRTPADWKQEEPAGRMRFAQFRLTKKGDDKYDAEVVIFKGIGGSTKDNINRWKSQFTPPEGKAIDDVAKVEQIKIGDREATALDVHGTYLMKTRPFDPNDKGEKRPDYRMVAIQLEGKTPYQIRLVGPASTIEAYKKGFDEWLRNFK